MGKIEVYYWGVYWSKLSVIWWNWIEKKIEIEIVYKNKVVFKFN